MEYKMEIIGEAHNRARVVKGEDLNALIVYAMGYIAGAYDIGLWKLTARILDNGKEVYRIESKSIVQ